jgi:hypothetical protein
MFRVTAIRYENETSVRTFKEYSDATEYAYAMIDAGFTVTIERL